MNATDYWPFAREYSIWNAAVAAWQFWTADLEDHVLSSNTEQVYNAFFYTTTTHRLCQQSEEVLFGHFITMLNAAFESKLVLEDKGYESGSEKFQYHSMQHTSTTSQSHCEPVCHWLSFSSSDDKESSPVHIPSNYTLPPQNPMSFAQQPLSKSIYTMCDDLEEEEDSQTVAMDDKHWNTEPVPDRHLCIHEHSQPHSLCPYPFSYSTDSTPTSYQDMLDLSDI